MIKIRAVGLPLVLLLSAGVLHRWIHATRAELAGIVRPLSAPLSDVPSDLGQFHMIREIPLDADIQRVADADEFIQREYIDRVTGKHIVLYVAYWGRENVGMGHGPEVCYPANGWGAADAPRSRSIAFRPPGETKQTSVALHRFIRVEPVAVARRAVGFVAVLDGIYQTSSRKSFWHRPGDRVGGRHYLAHMFVSTAAPNDDWETAESAIVAFMELALPHVWECLHEASEGRSSE